MKQIEVKWKNDGCQHRQIFVVFGLPIACVEFDGIAWIPYVRYSPLNYTALDIGGVETKKEAKLLIEKKLKIKIVK